MALFNGAWSTYPYFTSGSVVISGIKQGLFVVTPTGAAVGALSDVDVSGAWSSGTTSTCRTTSSGQCSVTASMNKNVASATFSVSNLTRADYTYSASANHDPDPDGDGDGDGTTINLTKP